MGREKGDIQGDGRQEDRQGDGKQEDTDKGRETERH